MCFFSRNVVEKRKCDQCLYIREYKSFDKKCFVFIEDFDLLLTPTYSDFANAKHSKNRLDQVEPVPLSLDDCNDVQKRIVIYYKLFLYIWDVYRTSNRMPIPVCILSSVRKKFKGGTDVGIKDF